MTDWMHQQYYLPGHRNAISWTNSVKRLQSDWNDWMTYDGTKEDYYSDAKWLGIIDRFTGGYATAERTRREQTAQLEYNMALYGIKWSDIKYPALTSGFNSTVNSTRSAVNFVSDNIGRLYR